MADRQEGTSETQQASIPQWMGLYTQLLLVAAVLYGASFFRPVYWRLVATHIRPFKHVIEPGAAGKPSSSMDELAALVKREKEQGQGDEGLVLRPVQLPHELNLEDYKLTKELVDANTVNGYVMLTWANFHYTDFAHNWVYHVKKVGVRGYMVGAMDNKLLEYLVASGVPTWAMGGGLTTGDLGWGSANFHKMGRLKIQLVKLFQEFSVDVILSDIDTVWMRNPIPYFMRFPEADILTSSDHLTAKEISEDLEPWPESGTAFNIGIMLFRAKSKAFVEKWNQVLEKPNYWDQSAFNDLSRQGASKSNESGLSKNLFKGWDGQVVVGILPISYFCSGHVFFTQQVHKVLGISPYVAHATYQYSGTDGKRHRFREALLWDDSESYFNNPKGYISMTIDIPEELMKAAAVGVKGPMVPSHLPAHFNLVHYQLAQLRTAMTVAYITDRIVIMPPIWCSLDKYWNGLEDGHIPGSSPFFKKPFVCPMDHIFEIPVWSRGYKGKHIGWREYSFLQNPRLPASVNNSRVELLVEGRSTSRALQFWASKSSTRTEVSVPADTKASALASTLKEQAPPSTAKILHLPQSTLSKLSSLWTSMMVQEADFSAQLKTMTTHFCCLSTSPSDVWYDFFSDIDHTDRFGREFKAGQFTLYGGTSKIVLPME